MENVLLDTLRERLPALNLEWSQKKPFRYVVVDDFLPTEMAEQLLAAYPRLDDGVWNNTTFVHQKKKFGMSTNLPVPVQAFFDLTATEQFRELVGKITGIDNLLSDATLAGGGLHQIIRGGFLDVHIDFNIHPITRHHRRLNLLLYLNKDWKQEYGGFLELWDMDAKKQIESVAPNFNRCVLFETNEISYHGHPRPLQTPDHITRKSLAIYYYTKEAPVGYQALEHNTMHRQTSGVQGYVKNFVAGIEASAQRLQRGGITALGETVSRHVNRWVRGLPPENR